jgi:hypothetical protein
MPDANTIGIGAPGNGDGANNPGRTNVYKWDGTSWIKKGKGIDGEGDGDRSGHSVSMPDENTIAIGAPSNINGADAGHVRVYSWNNSVWTQKGTDIDGEAEGDGSGWSVSMPDSNTVAIGAWENQANGINSGHVRIFGWNGNKWIQRGPDINGKPSDFFGWSICMPDVNTISIGGAQNPGLVRVYTLNNLNFSQNTFGNALKSFPNPTHGEMNIELGANYNDVSVIVRNATGQEVSRKSFNNANSLQFNIPGEPGFYTMEVAAQDKKALLKVMKK